MAAQPAGVSTTPPSLVSSANLLSTQTTVKSAHAQQDLQTVWYMYHEGKKKKKTKNGKVFLQLQKQVIFQNTYLYSNNLSEVMACTLTLDWLGRVMAVTGGSACGLLTSSRDNACNSHTPRGLQADVPFRMTQPQRFSVPRHQPAPFELLLHSGSIAHDLIQVISKIFQ